MKSRFKERPRQVVSEEVQRSLLELVQRKFYAGNGLQFAKDRRFVLRWVIYWPAREFFAKRAVTVPNGRYLEILSQIIIDAAAHQRGEIKYVPAWLGKAVQDHFHHQGERIYEEAKSMRSLADHALATLGKLPVKAPDDVVERFAAADRLLEASKRVAKRAVKPAVKAPVTEQLSFL